jgi:hypothetical protein
MAAVILALATLLAPMAALRSPAHREGCRCLTARPEALAART